MHVIINRFLDNGTQTLGQLVIVQGNEIIHQCVTLELPWRLNGRRISCIPTGAYTVKKRTSQKYGSHFHVTNVKGRDWILIHHGNYYSDIQGCILVGSHHKDINKDGHLDVVNSKKEMKKLNDKLPATFQLEIK
jgi:hypothetical protein